MPVNLFDANFYRAANPDLAELNNSQAFSHFQTFGLNEGREFSPFVNLNFYRSSNSDLANLNTQQIYNHLQNNGIAEKRSFSPFVDLNFYRAANSDLASLNNEQALQHLQINGLNEGRDFSIPFDVDEYKSLNLDLVAAGLNNSQLLQHFELKGLNEGRASSNDFNISYYLSNNSDLVAAGFNFKQAYDHYVVYGYNEERAGVAPPTQQWIRELPENISSSDVAVDSAGNVYLTGVTYISGGLNLGDTDAWVAKYDSSGNQQWTQQFGSSSYEVQPHLAVDGAGNVYITGSTKGSLEGTNAGGFDAWVAKYNSSGNQQWIQQFGRSGDDRSNELAVDGAGNVYLTGVIYSTIGEQLSEDGDGFVAKYNTSGNRQWIRQPSTFSYSSYNDVAVSSDGNIYTIGQANGTGLVTKYDSTGNSLWRQHSSPSSGRSYRGVAVDSIGNIYISGSRNGDGLITKYDSSGNQQWIQEFDNGLDGNNYDVESGIDLAVDSTNSVYVLGLSYLYPLSYGTIVSLVIKYDSSGYHVGTKFSGSGSRSGRGTVPYGIAVTSPNNFYLTGSNVTSEGNRTDFVARYS